MIIWWRHSSIERYQNLYLRSFGLLSVVFSHLTTLTVFVLFSQPTSASPTSGSAWRRPSPSSWASSWPSSSSSRSPSTTSTWSWRRPSPCSPEIAPCTRTCSRRQQQQHGGGSSGGSPQLSPKLTWQKTCLLDVPGLTPQRKKVPHDGLNPRRRNVCRLVPWAHRKPLEANGTAWGLAWM